MRSAGAIRTFSFFTILSIFVDLLWLFVYSPLRPITWDMMLALSRKDQVREPAHPQAFNNCRYGCTRLSRASAHHAAPQLTLLLSLLNTAYKVLVVWTAVSLQICFTQREALIEQMELDAGVGRAIAEPRATTSTGELLDARSLAAQVSR